jgi:hypothetical protein
MVLAILSYSLSDVPVVRRRPQHPARLRFRDLHEAFLNKPRCSRHSVGVYLDVGEQIHISVIVNPRRGTAKFYLDATFDQIDNEPLIWITRCYIRSAL